MIILLGFPKSGTTSFHHLFKSLGYNSYHQNYKSEYSIGRLIDNQIKNNKNLLDFIPENEKIKTAITQMDHCLSENLNYWHQITNYKELYYQNQDAIFILNIRNIQSLLKSFKNQYNKKISLYDRFLKYNSNLLNQNLNNDDDKLLELFKNHYNNIIKFYTEKNCKFIVFDIENDNLEKLSKYIDLKDFKKLPHKNKT